MPTISILTPVYNCELYIAHAIESVAASTFQDYEHIIVNDGSTDGTDWVITKTVSGLGPENQRKVRTFTQTNLGESYAVNRALDASIGQFVLVLNADDIIAPELLAKSYEVMSARPGVVVTYPDWVTIDAQGGSKRLVRTKEFSRHRMLSKFECLPGPGAMIRRRALSSERLRDPAFKFLSDFESWLRLSARGDFARIPHRLASWRDLSTNMTNQSRGLGWSEEAVKVAGEMVTRVRGTGRFWLHRSARLGEAAALTLAAQQRVWDVRVPGFMYVKRATSLGIKLWSPRVIIKAIFVFAVLMKKSMKERIVRFLALRVQNDP